MKLRRTKMAPISGPPCSDYP